MATRTLYLRKAVLAYVGLLLLLAGLLVWVIQEAREAGVPSLIWLAAVATVAAAAGPTLALAYLWSRPVAEILRTARILSSGRVSDTERITITGSDELAELGQAINTMRDRLVAQIRTIDRQRRNLELLVAGLEEGVVVADPSGRVVMSNPAARRLLGADTRSETEPDPWKGQVMETVIVQHDLQNMLLSDRPLDKRNSERTVELETSDGRRISLRARAGDLPLVREPPTEGSDSNVAIPPLGTEAEPMLGRLLVLSDVTDLTRSLKMKADFVANANHELRNPLNTMHMALENLLSMDRAADPETVERFLKIALGHCRRLEALVRDMLDLSRVENPAARFRTEPMELAAFLAELGQRYSDRVAARGLTWSVDCPDELRAMANPHLMGLVFNNLLDNAIKFTAAGGRISITVRPDGDRHVLIAVADTGTGIPPSDQDRVFERFYQVDRARSGPERGTGLGLSIVKHSVTAMDGTVRLTSELGRGTTVSVRLPAVP